MTFEQQLEISYKKLDSPMAEKWYSSALGKVEFGYKIVDMVLKHTEISDKEVLDVGCGDGGISVAFAKKGGNVVGLDLEEDRIELARLRALEHNVKVELIVGNAENTQFKDNSFDIIVCNAVIEHVFNPEKLASEISRVLKPGGILFIDTPSRYSVLQLVSDTHYNLFGISIMPRWLAAYYTVSIRKRYYKYDVSDLRTYRYLKKEFLKNNIVFIADANITLLVDQIKGKLSLPDKGLRTIVINIFKNFHMSWLLIAFVKSWFYRTFITSGWSLIGKKI